MLVYGSFAKEAHYIWQPGFYVDKHQSNAPIAWLKYVTNCLVAAAGQVEVAYSIGMDKIKRAKVVTSA